MLHLLFTNLFAAAWRWHDRRKAIRTLSGLNDRLLRDIGLERHDIEAAVDGRVGPPAGWHRPGGRRPGRMVVLPNGTLMDAACCPAPRRA